MDQIDRDNSCIPMISSSPCDKRFVFFFDSCWQCLLFFFLFFKCLFLFVCECGSCFVCWSHDLFELELFVKMLIAMYIFSG